MARPTKYSEEIAAKIVEGIELGLTYKLAAAYGGVSEPSFHRWRARFDGFDKRIREAEGKGAAANMLRIQKEAQSGDWRAAAWIMEHRYPEDYGRLVHEARIAAKIATEDPVRLIISGA